MLLDLLGIGSNIIGGAMGMRSASKSRALTREQMKQAKMQFDAQMDTSVTRRVKDAKRAGIHPLFAMGASVGASPTISAGGVPRTDTSGQRAAEGVSRSLGNIAVNASIAKRNEAEAALLNSQKARLDNDLVSRGRDTPGLMGPADDRVSAGPVEIGPATYYSPEVPFSSEPGVRAGPPPETYDVVQQDGRRIRLLNPDLNMDEIGQVQYLYEKTRMATTNQIERLAHLVKNTRQQLMLPIMERQLSVAQRANRAWKRKGITPQEYWDRVLDTFQGYLQRLTK